MKIARLIAFGFALLCGAANADAAFTDDEAQMIERAKSRVRQMVYRPETLVFNDLYTRTAGNMVLLKCTAMNPFLFRKTYYIEIEILDGSERVRAVRGSKD